MEKLYRDMKLQLDENTLNAYINEAIRQELAENNTDELFGSRVRKQSRRMITGQGWGNQKRSENGFMAANSDISATDADEVVPQTLVGMIKQMDKGLATIEQFAGLNGQYEGLGEKVAAYRNGGGFKMKQSLLNAIGALSRLADRLNAVERKSGSNAIMESAGDYMDATVAGNAAVGNARNMAQLGGLQKTAKSASAAQSAAGRALNKARGFTKLDKPLQMLVQRMGAIDQQAGIRVMDGALFPRSDGTLFIDVKKIVDGAKTNPAFAKDSEILKYAKALNGQYGYTVFSPEKFGAYGNAIAKNTKASQALKAANISRNTGFWGKQWANVKNGAKDVKTGFNTIKGAGTYGKEVAGKAAKLGNTLGKDAASAARIGRAAKARQVANGLKIGFGGIGKVSQIPMLLLSIADEAARQGAEARQRKIVRTYNCASVLAKRIANIAQEIADAQGGQEQEQLQEINVRKSRKFFDSIEAGMNLLSQKMKEIGSALNGAGQDGDVQIPQSLNTPQEIEQFQNWANANGFKDERGMELVPDGKWGQHTDYAYEQAKQALTRGDVNESRIKLNEGSAVMRALTDLENKVGVTGSGGRAYSDISRMSGAYDGSRSQGARAAKFIIRTYPPVLNQYLGILADAGANVQGIQPLKVDNRPHRDYDWNELQEIDNRIKQLYQIANSVESVEPRRGNVTLPPKPAWNPQPVQRQPQQKAPEVPELDDTVEVEDEPIEPIEDEPIEMKPDEPLSVTKFGYANPKTGEQLQPWQYVDSIIDYMKDALNGDTNSIRSKRKEMGEIYQKAWDTIDQNMRTGVYTEEQARAQKKKLNYYYRQFRRGKEDVTPRYTVSEEAFKKLVKQMIRESMNK